MTDRVEMIRQRLTQTLIPEALDIEDESHLHRGHAGAAAGGGHYRVRIVSDAFRGRGTVQRHRLVYEALDDAMRPDCIHALSIQALTPDETSTK